MSRGGGFGGGRISSILLNAGKSFFPYLGNDEKKRV